MGDKGGNGHCDCCQNNEQALRLEVEATLVTVRKTLIDKIEQLHTRMEAQEMIERSAQDSVVKRGANLAKQRIGMALTELTRHLGEVETKEGDCANIIARARYSATAVWL